MAEHVVMNASANAPKPSLGVPPPPVDSLLATPPAIPLIPARPAAPVRPVAAPTPPPRTSPTPRWIEVPKNRPRPAATARTASPARRPTRPAVIGIGTVAVLTAVAGAGFAAGTSEAAAEMAVPAGALVVLVVVVGLVVWVRVARPAVGRMADAATRLPRSRR